MELKGVLQLEILTADGEQDQLCQGDERNENWRWPHHQLLPVCHAVEVFDQLGVTLLIPAKKKCSQKYDKKKELTPSQFDPGMG